MVVRLFAKIKLDTMESTVLYPVDEVSEEVSEERIALLTGIVQLVSTALNRAGDSDTTEPMFMKSGKGVIGYVKLEPFLFICQGDSEGETRDPLKAIISNPEATGQDLASHVLKAVKQRGKEIGDLWR